MATIILMLRNVQYKNCDFCFSLPIMNGLPHTVMGILCVSTSCCLNMRLRLPCLCLTAWLAVFFLPTGRHSTVFGAEPPTAIVSADGELLWGWILHKDGHGIHVKVLDRTEPVAFAWHELATATQKQLHRERFSPSQGEPSAQRHDGMTEAVSVKLQDGVVPIVGVVVRDNDADNTLVLKSRWGEITLPKDEIVSQETLRVPWSSLYAPREIYVKHLMRSPPKTMEDYRAMAAMALDLGLFDEATIQYQRVMDMAPAAVREIEAEMAHVESARYEKDASGLYQKALTAISNKDFHAFYTMAEDLLMQYPKSEAAEDIVKVFDSVDDQFDCWLDDKVPAVWLHNMDVVCGEIARLRGLKFDMVQNFAQTGLEEEITQKTASTLDISLERVRDKMRKRTLPPRRYSYGAATWLRTRQEGPFQAWWEQSGVESRARYLTGVCIESHLHVIRYRDTTCPLCDGSGEMRRRALFHPAIPGGEAAARLFFDFNADEGLCPRCRGERRDKVIVYQ